MVSKLYTAALQGLNCKIVEVEVDYRKAGSYMAIVGLADKSVQEAKDRIPSAIRSSGAEYLPVRVVMNLAPAELNKSGPSYDLPLAVGYLIASDQLIFDPSDKLFIGELALDGRVRPVSGILPITDSAKKLGFREIYLPSANANEASLIKGVKILPIDNLKDIIEHFNGSIEIQEHEHRIDSKSSKAQNEYDFSQVQGQEQAKRVLEIAAAGGHNVLMSGVPGSGKTLLSRCFPTILPKMQTEESLEVTRIYSVSGLLDKNKSLIDVRPFRTPHHTSSQVALVGGGGQIKPGEISLSHRGVLFLDEFPEFSSKALEALRQPLEDKVVTISRASGSFTFPANFTLIAAMNPCKCGFKGDPTKQCTCSSLEVKRYIKKISGPILDRIDLLINVPKVEKEKLFDGSEKESSEKIRERVEDARSLQIERYKDLGNIFSNGDLSQKAIKEFIKIDEETKDILKLAVTKMDLSARSYFRLLKVSRTIADLEGSKSIKKDHVIEALGYRVEIGT